MAPTIYYDPTSPCCQAPLAFARLVGIELQHELVDLAKGEQRKPEYLSLYSLGHVPFLKDDDVAIPEGAAILIYLAQKYATKPEDEHWMPRSPAAAAPVHSALSWLECSLRPYSVGVAIALAFAVLDGHEPDPAEVARLTPKLKSGLDDLERWWLKDGKRFVAGDEISVADLMIAYEIDMLQVLVTDDEVNYDALVDARPTLKAYLERVRAACAPAYDEYLKATLVVRDILNKSTK